MIRLKWHDQDTCCLSAPLPLFSLHSLIASRLVDATWLQELQPSSPPAPVNSPELTPAFPTECSLTVESSRTGVNRHPWEAQGCYPWNSVPAAGRNQALLKLIVLHSPEFSSGISEQRNLLPHRNPSQTWTGSHPWGPSSRSPTMKSSQEELGKVVFVIQIHLSRAVRWSHTMASSKERPLIFSIGINLKFLWLSWRSRHPDCGLGKEDHVCSNHRLRYPTKSLCFGVNVLVTPCTLSPSVSESESILGSTVIL